MKKYILIALMSYLHLSLLAQSREIAYQLDDQFNLWNKKNNDEAVVFADVAYIRDYPGTKGELIDSLVHGDRVQIISEGYNPSTIRGFTAPWHKIKYQVNKKEKEGYIWLGLLALGKETNNKGESFIYGFLRKNKETNNDNGVYILEVKCFDKDNRLLTKINYPTDLSDQSYAESKMLSNMGLEGLESIHRIGFLGEACGIPSNYYYFGWNGSNLIAMLEKTIVSDAGIYYYEETILFPSEHHLDKNLIIKDMEEGEAIDEHTDEVQYKTKKKRKKYTWTGRSVTELVELK